MKIVLKWFKNFKSVNSNNFQIRLLTRINHNFSDLLKMTVVRWNIKDSSQNITCRTWFAQFLKVGKFTDILMNNNEKLQNNGAFDDSVLQTWQAVFFVNASSNRKTIEKWFLPLHPLLLSPFVLVAKRGNQKCRLIWPINDNGTVLIR